MAEPTTEHLRLPELTDEQREQLLQRAAETGAMLRLIVEAARTASRDDYALAPPRPSWQSPYGSPPRR